MRVVMGRDWRMYIWFSSPIAHSMSCGVPIVFCIFSPISASSNACSSLRLDLEPSAVSSSTYSTPPSVPLAIMPLALISLARILNVPSPLRPRTYLSGVAFPETRASPRPRVDSIKNSEPSVLRGLTVNMTPALLEDIIYCTRTAILASASANPPRLP